MRGATAICRTAHDGCIIGGWYNATAGNNWDNLLLELDANGIVQWSRNFGDSLWECLRDVAVHPDGRIFAVGDWQDALSQTDHVRVWCFHPDGEMLWQRSLESGDNENAVAVLPTANGIAVATSYRAPGQETYNACLLLLDSAGILRTRHLYPDPEGTGSYATSLRTTADGGFILAGTSLSHQSDVLLLRTDSLGQPEWSRCYDVGGPWWQDIAVGVCQTSDGGFVVGGWTADRGDIFLDGANLMLLKTDADGNRLWTRFIGGPENDFANSFTPTLDGGFLLAGETQYADNAQNSVYLVRTDADGLPIWSRTWDDVNYRACVATLALSDYSFLLTGVETSRNSGVWDLFARRTGPDLPLSVAAPATLSTEPGLTIYPNPANAMLALSLELPRAGVARVTLFDMRGRLVATLQDGAMEAGIHVIRVSAAQFASGVYIASLRTTAGIVNQKMVVLK